MIHALAEVGRNIRSVAQAKHNLQAGDVRSGVCLPILGPRLDLIDFYKVSKLKVMLRTAIVKNVAPPQSDYYKRFKKTYPLLQ